MEEIFPADEAAEVEPILVGVKEAARRLGVSQDKVREWARRAVDPLPAINTGTDTKEHWYVFAAECRPDGIWLRRESERTRPMARR